MEVLTNEDVLAALDYLPLIDWMENQHRLAPADLEDLYMEADGGTAFLVRPAWAAGQSLGVKLASVFPANDVVPLVHAVYVLFSGTDGTPVAIIDGPALTWFKTACDSALGARLLARPDVADLLMVGAGAMAPHLIRAHRAVRPSLETVTIWNRTRSRAERLAAELGEEGFTVRVADDLVEAIGHADVISTATMSREPLIKGAELSPGTHVDLVGAYTPAMREADDEVMRRAGIFVDSRATTVRAIGDLSLPIASGAIDEADVLADLYQLASGGHPGRTSDEQITVFENGGGGHLDLMTAQFALDQHRSRAR